MQDMPEPENSGCVLGFDYGLKRIGVAVGQMVTGTASPLKVLNNQPALIWQGVNGLIDEWKPRVIVVGLPLALDDSETEMSLKCRKFARQVHGRSRLPVYLQDERLTSKAADSEFAQLRAAGVKKRKHANSLDSIAAQVMLEDWLAGPRETTAP
jgi:putative Holliday junction resolvase